VQCISLEDVGPISIPVWNTFLESALRSPTLKSLDLSRNDLSQEHMLVLAHGLEHNTILTSLVLSENPIRDEGLKLPRCQACKISDKGTQALTHCLRTNCHLERLYLYANPLDYFSPEKSEQVYWLDLSARGRAYLRREDCRSELISRILSRANESPELVSGLLKELPHVWTPRTLAL
jgi:Leucine-rich repeat (LRR) protein